MNVAMRHENPEDPQGTFIEVRYMGGEPGGPVSVAIGDHGRAAQWTMTPALAADLIAALARSLAETMAAMR